MSGCPRRPGPILAVDLGSSTFKAMLFDPDLAPRGAGEADLRYLPAGEGRVEIAVRDAEEAFRSGVAEALSNAGMKASEVAAVALTSQAQTFTVRSPDGGARLPFISWRDERCAGRNPAAGLPDFAAHCSVHECLPLLAVSKLAFLQAESNRGLVRGRDLVLMLPTWFVVRLTGRAVLDRNLAAMSGLYSMVHEGWWYQALRACSIGRKNLPAVVELGAVAGRTVDSAADFGLPPGLPVIAAGNDQTAGACGARLQREGAVLVTLGTAQVAYAVCDELPPPAAGTMRGPYPGGRFYRLAADTCGAGTVNWARGRLRECASPEALDRAAGDAPEDCGGVCFVADGPAGSGRWLGGSAATTSGEKARAVFTCLAERLANMLAMLGPQAADRKLLVAGGGSRSTTWLECIRRRLGRPLQRTEFASPCLGAARLARAATGRNPGSGS